MNEYDFGLHFKLADYKTDPSIYEDRLFEAGCDDALLGNGQRGYIGLDFIRTSKMQSRLFIVPLKMLKALYLTPNFTISRQTL